MTPASSPPASVIDAIKAVTFSLTSFASVIPDVIFLTCSIVDAKES